MVGRAEVIDSPAPTEYDQRVRGGKCDDRKNLRSGGTFPVRSSSARRCRAESDLPAIRPRPISLPSERLTGERTLGVLP